SATLTLTPASALAASPPPPATAGDVPGAFATGAAAGVGAAPNGSGTLGRADLRPLSDSRAIARFGSVPSTATEPDAPPPPEAPGRGGAPLREAPAAERVEPLVDLLARRRGLVAHPRGASRDQVPDRRDAGAHRLVLRREPAGGAVGQRDEPATRRGGLRL